MPTSPLLSRISDRFSPRQLSQPFSPHERPLGPSRANASDYSSTSSSNSLLYSETKSSTYTDADVVLHKSPPEVIGAAPASPRLGGARESARVHTSARFKYTQHEGVNFIQSGRTPELTRCEDEVCPRLRLLALAGPANKSSFPGGP